MSAASRPQLLNREIVQQRISRIFQTDTKTVIKTSGEILNLPPYRYVNEGELLEVVKMEGQVCEVTKLVYDKFEKVDRRVKLYPSYSLTEIVQIPPHSLPITFTERTNAEWKQAKLLEKFHYRGMGLDRIVGRRSVLLARLEGVGVIGYGVVSGSVLASRPRFQLLRTNVGEILRTKFINKLVRIPRIVIHPEFRGIGLGALMARHLVQYVRDRWDVRGYGPVMVEVIAAMTEYHRFFQAAGFLDAGYTEGYKGPGIVPRYGHGSFENRNNTDKYRFMVNQGPKPYLVFPLTEELTRKAASFFEHTTRTKSIAKPIPLLNRNISFVKTSITYKARNGLSKRAMQIKEAFGVDSSQMYSPVLRKFSFTAEPGDMVLLTGASGSGKSTIIKLLTERKENIRRLLRVEGRCPTVRAKVALLNSKFDVGRPLVDQVGQELHEAIRTLNSVGLAEAHLYLKRPHQLSEGQKYRFSVALLCESQKPIWIADEFASSLDPLNAAIAAKGLRRIAYKRGATCIIAAPHIGHFSDSLVPNVLIHLRWGGIATISAIRVARNKTKEGWRLRITNCGMTQLEEVRVGGIDHLGNTHELGKLGSLRPFRHVLFQLHSETIQEYRAVRISTDKTVGEIFYLD